MFNVKNTDFAKLIANAKAAGVDPSDGAALDAYMKAHIKEVSGSRADSGWVYQNGPFSLIDGDIISEVVQGGSDLVQWLPTKLVTARFERVAHLEWVAPHGFDGSQTYRDWLSTIVIADCDYGPTTDWNGFEYQMDGGEWSWQSPVVTIRDFGQKDFEQTPTYTVRGDNMGMISIDNDADWGIARAMIANEQHVNYVYVYGDRNNSQMEIDGIDQIITTGYVQNKRVGKGTPTFANPLVVNGASLQTPKEVIVAIRMVIRRLLLRAKQRQWAIADKDMAVVLPATMWVYIAEELAKTGGYTNLWPSNYSDFRRERDSVLTSMSFPVDGRNIPVLLDNTMGQNVTLNAGLSTESSGVSGDIFVLTRRANGIALLEAQFLDWNQFDNPKITSNNFSLLGGVARGGWKVTNEKCYQYFVEMAGRLVTRFQPLQARINNVVVETLMGNEMESPNFTSPNFYAYEGKRGGAGVALLNPL